MSKTQALQKLYRALQTAELSEEVRTLLKDKVSLLESEREDDKSTISDLQKENKKLKEKLQKLEPVGFIESEGLLWKKKSDGTFERRPYCPHCANNPIMSQFPPGMKMEWICSKCNFGADGKIEPPKD